MSKWLMLPDAPIRVRTGTFVADLTLNDLLHLPRPVRRDQVAPIVSVWLTMFARMAVRRPDLAHGQQTNLPVHRALGPHDVGWPLAGS